MKKTLLILGLGIASFSSSFAQKDKAIEKLRNLYGDENFQDCAHDAIKFSLNKKHKDNPEVYIYASMACLRISQNNEGKSEFKKSFSDALGFAAKYRKKDRNGQFYGEYITHFEELKKIVAEEVENNFLEERKEKIYKAAKQSLGLMKKMIKVDPDDYGIALVSGVLQLAIKNNSQGKKMIALLMPELKRLAATANKMEDPPELSEKQIIKKERKMKEAFGFTSMKVIKPFDEMSEMEQVYLRLGLIEYAKYLFKKKKVEEAKEVIKIGKPFFYDENELYLREYNTSYKDTYDTIFG